MKAPTPINFLWALLMVKSVAAANVSIVYITSTVVFTSTVDTNDTVTPSRTGATTASFSQTSFSTTSAYPACISFVNGSAVAVPINGSTPSSSVASHTNTIVSQTHTRSSDFNATTLSSRPTGTGTFVVSTTAVPAAPSSRPFAPRQNPSRPVSIVLSSTASPHPGNVSQTVTVAYPSNFGGTNASATFSAAVIAYPTAYPGPYPPVLPLCADLGINPSSTLASNNSLPSPTSNTSAADDTSNQKGDHSEASRLGKSLSAAFLSVGFAFAALLM